MIFIKLQKTDFKQSLEPVLLLRPFHSTALTALGEYVICSCTTQVITRLYVNKALFAKWISQNTLSGDGDAHSQIGGATAPWGCKTQGHVKSCLRGCGQVPP